MNSLHSALYRGVQRAAMRNNIMLQRNFKSTLTKLETSPAPSPTLMRQWYNTFGKSMALYGSWMILLIVIGEFTFGKLTDGLWTMNNYGKTFETVDWTPFHQADEEEE